MPSTSSAPRPASRSAAAGGRASRARRAARCHRRGDRRCSRRSRPRRPPSRSRRPPPSSAARASALLGEAVEPVHVSASSVRPRPGPSRSCASRASGSRRRAARPEPRRSAGPSPPAPARGRRSAPGVVGRQRRRGLAVHDRPGSAGDRVGVAHHLAERLQVHPGGLGQPLRLGDGGEGDEVDQVARQLHRRPRPDGAGVQHPAPHQRQGVAALLEVALARRRP